MSTVNTVPDFNPTTRVVDPPNRPDQVAEAVLASLSRGRWGFKGRPWGVVKTAIVSYITLGIAPLLIWPKRMRNFMSSEQQQLWLLADWLRLRTGKPEAVALRDEAARDVGPGLPSRAAHCIIVTLAALVFLQLVTNRFFDPGSLWSVVWSQRHHGPGIYSRFLPAWSLLLTAGYLLYWLQICAHAKALENYVARFNALTAAEGIAPVIVPPVGAGLDLVWIVGGLIGLFNGAIWAAPLALAGALQHRYVWVTSRQTRADLARRVRTMLDGQRPALDVRLTPRVSSAPCPNQKCHAPLRPGAAFCPRCGTRTA
jgi:zinc ribbon protein